MRLLSGRGSPRKICPAQRRGGIFASALPGFRLALVKDLPPNERFGVMRSLRWEAISKIVIAFINKGHPRLALAALALILLTGITAIALVALSGARVLNIH